MDARKDSGGDNPAQIKGDINRGLSGDKRPGFDPAAAPLETDAEAGGTPFSAEQVEVARQSQNRGVNSERTGTYGNAMRRFDGGRDERSWRAFWQIAAAALVLATLGAAFFLWRA